jgi:CHAD domain-containing protein
VTLEREIELEAPAAFSLPSFDAELRASRPRSRTVISTYIDTADLRILRWGAAVRHRAEEGWTVKLPARAEGDVLERAEETFAGDDARRPPPAALDLVRAFVRDAPVAPVGRVRALRREIRIADRRGRTIATVTDDDAEILLGDRAGERFREIEVRPEARVERAVLERILSRLRTGGATRIDAMRKLERALIRDQAPEVVIEGLTGDATVFQLVRRAFASSAVRLISHDPWVRLGGDPEAIHQARVATRRLRSDLRTFRDALAATWASSLRTELRPLADDLGAVRDAEVLSDRIRGRGGSLEEQDRPGLDVLVAMLERRRATARRRLMTHLRSGRYVALLDRVVGAARDPSVRPRRAPEPARQRTASILEGPWTELERAVARADTSANDRDLHLVRIAAKRVRYAAEAVEPVHGKRARAFADAVASLQDVLGEHQDAVVAMAFLRRASSKSPRARFVAGALTGLELAARAQARSRWRPAWEALDRKQLRFWT